MQVYWKNSLKLPLGYLHNVYERQVYFVAIFIAPFKISYYAHINILKTKKKTSDLNICDKEYLIYIYTDI